MYYAVRFQQKADKTEVRNTKSFETSDEAEEQSYRNYIADKDSPETHEKDPSKPIIFRSDVAVIDERGSVSYKHGFNTSDDLADIKTLYVYRIQQKTDGSNPVNITPFPAINGVVDLDGALMRLYSCMAADIKDSTVLSVNCFIMDINFNRLEEENWQKHVFENTEIQTEA